MKQIAMWGGIVLFSGLASLAAAEPWQQLFDGKTLKGWTSASGGEPGKGWVVEDGVLRRAAAGGDLISEKDYGDFEMEFEWQISRKGNSGVKYRLRKTPGGWVGPEYQVLDDEGHPNGKVADTSAGSLYEVLAPAKDKPLKPAGEWNRSRIVARGKTLEHWLNGVCVLKVEVGSEEWQKGKQESKFRGVEGYGEPGPGRILLQDHGDEVRFRSIRLRELPAGKE